MNLHFIETGLGQQTTQGPLAASSTLYSRQPPRPVDHVVNRIRIGIADSSERGVTSQTIFEPRGEARDRRTRTDRSPALAEVRQAIGGYRAGTLEEEFARALSTLESAGVSVDCNASPVTLTPVQETLLALVRREAVTKVVRHAQAQLCSLRLERTGHAGRLEIQDDG